MGDMRTIKIRSHSYRDSDGAWYTPRRGEQVDFDSLTEEEQQRALDLDVFESDEDDTEDEGGYDFENMTTEDMVEWIEEEEPNVTETIKAMGNDPVIAQKMLDAEEAATGGEPRTGVSKAAQKIIGT